LNKIILDASALLRFVDNDAGADRIEALLDQARTGKVEIVISAVNWGEIVHSLLRARGGEQVNELLPKLRALPIKISVVTQDSAEDAAKFKYSHKLAYADAFAGSLALSQSATLVTADQDFRPIPASALKVDFLPNKSKS
jgi:predicted nucleic acid-binding protein